MVTGYEIECQLKSIGVKANGWGRNEISELENVIDPKEQIVYCVNGYSEAGFVLLCVTNHRVLLVDKKPFYSLTVEDINYDMVSDVVYDAKILVSSVNIYSLSKTMKFNCVGKRLLRHAVAYIQSQVLQSTQQKALLSTNSSDRFISSEVLAKVISFEHQVANPYMKVPISVRRRVFAGR